MERLLDLILRLLDLFPRFKAITPDEGGVVIRFGKYIKTLDNGYYWHWPVITEIRTLNIVRQPIDVDLQDMTTRDGKPFSINMSVFYTVENPRKALLDNMDYDENLQEVAGDAMRKAVGNTDLVHINVDKLVETVYDTIDKKSDEYGLAILDVMVPTATRAKPIRIIQ